MSDDYQCKDMLQQVRIRIQMSVSKMIHGTSKSAKRYASQTAQNDKESFPYLRVFYESQWHERTYSKEYNTNPHILCKP